MSILDIFQSRQPIQQQPVQQPQPTQQQAPGAPGNPAVAAPAGPTATPGVNDPLALQAGKQPGGESPLSNFAELWKIEDKDKPADFIAAMSPNFNIDPTAVATAARSIDYAKLVPPDVITKAMSGDAVAFGEVLNAVTQAATANAGMNSAKIVEAALAHQAQKFAELLPSEVRKSQISMQVNQDHPIFQNPAAAPMVESLKNQFAAKYPTATAQQISDFTANYLTDFVKAVGGTMPDANATTAAANASAKSGEKENWNMFFGLK